MTVQCSSCGQFKTKIISGYNKLASRNMYSDEHGKHWNGRTCPACYLVKQKLRKKKESQERAHTKLKKDTSNISYYILKDTKLRKCRSCGKLNHNYFRCPSCLNDLRYHGHGSLLSAESCESMGSGVIV